MSPATSTSSTMASKALIPIFVVMMLISGVCNTLLSKYQDSICVRNCTSPDPSSRVLFAQPVLQTAQMFVGETGCWLFVAAFRLRDRWTSRKKDRGRGRYEVVDANEVGETGVQLNKVMGLRDEEGRVRMTGWRTGLLALPAVCDIGGTTLMNVGLLFVVASIYQMTRGALVLFVGLFSVIFLSRKLHAYQWFALFTVVTGVGIVGLAGAVYKDDKAIPSAETVRETLMLAVRTTRSPSAVRTIVGVLLIAGAQIFTASQFVLEEHILEKYALEPLKVVSWEGTFGLLFTLLGMIVMHLAVGRTEAGRYGYFDMVEGWREFTEYKVIGVTSILIMISIGAFNFFGLSVTRTVSATSRSTIDTCRTLFIWVVSLFLGWETFKWLQVVGFLLLVYGTFLFNGLIRPPLRKWVAPEHEPALLPEEPIEHN